MTPEQFLKTIFGARAPDAWLAAVPGDPGDRANAGSWKGGRASSLLSRLSPDTNNFWCVGLPRAGGQRLKQDIEAVYAVVLEDVGTKTAAEWTPAAIANTTPLGAPRFVTLTSKGNFQWVYQIRAPGGAWTDIPAFKRLMACLGALGLSDPGCLDETRFVRAPWGKNGKPAKALPDGSAPDVRLVKDNPGAVPLDLPAVLAWAEGLVAARGLDRRASTLVVNDAKTPVADLGNPDVWLRALSELGLVRGEGNKPGVVDVVCPFVEEHSDGRDDGTAYLGAGAFQCFHGHCQGRTPKEWQARIEQLLEEDAGGLVSGRTRVVRLVFDEPVDTESVETLARRVSEELGESRRLGEQALRDKHGVRLDRASPTTWDEVLASYAWVRSLERFARLDEPRVFLTKEAFAVDCRLVPGVKVGKTGVDAAAGQFHALKGLVLDKPDYLPGKDRVVGAVLNLWSPSRVLPEIGVVDQDVQVWLDALAYTVPDQAAREVLLDYMAYRLSHRGEKVSWCPVIRGVQGCGKDTLWTPFFRILGPENCKTVSMSELTSGFNSRWIVAEQIVFNEMATPGRVDVYNDKLKPLVARPPEVLEVSTKFLAGYEIENRVGTCGFTNKDNAIALEDGDRRFWIYASPAGRMPAAMSKRVWDWFDDPAAGASGKVYGWLLARQTGAGFNPAVCPPDVGTAKQDMTVAALPAAGRWVVDTYAGRDLLIVERVVRDATRPGSPAPPAVHRSINAQIVTEAFRAMGGRRWRDGAQLRLDNQRVRVWVFERFELYEQLDADKMRDAVNRVSGPGADARETFVENPKIP